MELTTSTIYPDRVANLEEALFQKPPVYRDTVFITGLVLVLISATIFFFPAIAPKAIDQSSMIGVFFVNYALAAVYFVLLLLTGLLKFRWETTKNYTENIFLFLILSLISAFSLNRDLPVFEQATTWLTISLVGLCVTLLALCFRRQLPKPVMYGLYFLLGTGLVLYLYFSLYLLPMYPIGFIGFIFLGISLHVFVPLFSLLFTGFHLYRAGRKDKRIAYAGLAGIAMPLCVVAFFLMSWENVKNKVNFALNATTMEEEQLPNWVAVSRQLPSTPIAEMLVKTDLVYTTPGKFFEGFGMPSRSFNETRKHDPLVMIATLLLGKPELSETERIKVLEAMYDSRHHAQERLWTGQDLKTSNVVSNVMIYPEYRMAYTEKILSINNSNAWERNQQEAVYTFHLPEGGVVTSLSLWINGIEEKGILTTKAKADSAYKTIVGVEVRDPSVVHWQEGNTVSVRVFPCTPQENRRFKLGVTAPLRKEGNRLTYQNIYFDGPEAGGATETVQLRFTSLPQDLDLPFTFDSENAFSFLSNQSYKPYWQLSMQEVPLSANAFSFDGNSYQVQEYKKKLIPFKPQRIYLDLNKSWETMELMDVWKQIKSNEVYVFQGKMVRLTDENLKDVVDDLRQQNFSLFPVHLIPNPEKALIITKSSGLSPNVKDLQGSAFSEHLTRALQQPAKIRLYNLGPELSPYLKTLKELRVFTYDQGTVEELNAILKKQQFVEQQEDERTVVIDNAGLKLVETAGMKTDKAPDHLLRLFTYNHLMQQIAGTYFKENFVSEEVIAKAQKAYIISPVSSLIVLESQADYERFNIKDSQNASLRNASMHGSGSVPEPHEWFLIILVAMVAFYLYFRPNLSTIFRS